MMRYDLMVFVLESRSEFLHIEIRAAVPACQ